MSRIDRIAVSGRTQNQIFKNTKSNFENTKSNFEDTKSNFEDTKQTPSTPLKRKRTEQKSATKQPQQACENPSGRIENVQITNAITSKRMYITGIFASTGKRHHIISLNSKQCSNYKDVITELKATIENANGNIQKKEIVEKAKSMMIK